MRDELGYKHEALLLLEEEEEKYLSLNMFAFICLKNCYRKVRTILIFFSFLLIYIFITLNKETSTMTVENSCGDCIDGFL